MPLTRPFGRFFHVLTVQTARMFSGNVAFTATAVAQLQWADQTERLRLRQKQCFQKTIWRVEQSNKEKSAELAI